MSGYRRSKRKAGAAAPAGRKYPRRYQYKRLNRAVFRKAPYSNAIDRFTPQNSMSYHGSSFMPDRFSNIMHYRERWSVTDALGYISYTYTMNGAYDPYVPAGGASCYGWDKMIFNYKKYMVTGSKIQITYVNIDENDPVEMTVYPSHDAVAAGSGASGQPEAHHIIVTNQAGKETVSHFKSIKQMGFPVANEIDLSANNDAWPAKQYYWQIRLDGTGGTALNGQLEVDIWYYTTWFDREKIDNTI